MSRMSELSSIISNRMQDPFKKDNQQEADSIKHDVQNISQYLKGRQEIQKLDLDELVKNRQLKLDERIHIEQQ